MQITRTYIEDMNYLLGHPPQIITEPPGFLIGLGQVRARIGQQEEVRAGIGRERAGMGQEVRAGIGRERQEEVRAGILLRNRKSTRQINL
jgi:hypothetical protein